MKARKLRGLLAVLLALVLTLTMMPAVFAENKLQNQIDMGAATMTVTLEASTIECIVIPAGKTVTLKLNGCTLSNKGLDRDTISNYGTLIIEGYGIVESVSTGKAAIVNYPDAKVEIRGGAINGTAWYVIKNMGVMEIYDGTNVKSFDEGSSMIANGFFGNTTTDRGETGQPDKAKLTIYGGKLIGGLYNIKNDAYGELLIKGGTFENTGNGSLQNCHKATIEGGSFTCSGYPMFINGAYDAVSDVGQLKITGGTFHNENEKIFGAASKAKDGMGELVVEGGKFTGVMPDEYDGLTYKLTISSGEFSARILDRYLAEGAACANIRRGDELVYVVGKVLIEEKVATLGQDDMVEMLQNITELNNVPAGVIVVNCTGESVTVNGETLEDGSEIVIPEPKPVEQPSGPVYYPDYDEKPTAPEQTSQRFVVNCRKLNVRAGASTSAAKIGTLSRGTVIEGVAEDGWVKFTTADGRVGYVSAAYLCALDADGQALTVVCRKLNVRAGAGTGYEKVGTLSRGQTVEVLGAADGWYRIAYGDGTAWVSAQYVA
ncbi:MAG: SH3 domain-containing protein [Candidatus Spyradocola sp.]